MNHKKMARAAFDVALIAGFVVYAAVGAAIAWLGLTHDDTAAVIAGVLVTVAGLGGAAVMSAAIWYERRVTRWLDQVAARRDEVEQN